MDQVLLTAFRCITVLAACLWWVSPVRANQDGTVLRNILYNAPTDGATITWPPGTYNIGEDPGAAGYVFNLFVTDPTNTDARRSRTNLTLNATGVTLVVTKPNIGVFNLFGCNGLTITGLTIDFNPVPWNQSTITAVNATLGNFDVTLSPGYLPFTDPAFGSLPFKAHGVLFDPVTRLVKQNTSQDFLKVTGVVTTGGSNYRLLIDPNDAGGMAYLQSFQVGDLYVQSTPGAPAFNIAGCEPTASHDYPFRIDGVTCYAASFNFFAVDTSPMISSTGQPQIVNCTMTKPTPDGGRLTSCAGGGMIASGNRKGLYMNNCTIEYCQDDCVDFVVHGRLFTSYYDPNRTDQVNFSAGVAWHSGDSIQLFDPATGAVASYTITAISVENSFGPVTVQFDQCVPGLYGNGTIDGSVQGYDTNMANPDSEVRNSTFGKNRGNGAVLTWQGRFISNTVDTPGGHGVVVSNIYTHFAGGPVPKFVTVRNNVLNHCGRLSTFAQDIHGAAILMMGQKAPGDTTPADSPTVEWCGLEGNFINGWVSHGVYVRSAKNCYVVGWTGPNPHDQMFSGAQHAADRAVYVASPTLATTIDAVNATAVSGMLYAVTFGFGVDATMTPTNIHVTSPTLPFEDQRQ